MLFVIVTFLYKIVKINFIKEIQTDFSLSICSVVESHFLPGGNYCLF